MSAAARILSTTDTTHIVVIHIAPVVKPVYIFLARNRISKSYLMADVYFHRFVHFGCVVIYVFSFHHKQCPDNSKDFTFVKFTSQISVKPMIP